MDVFYLYLTLTTIVFFINKKYSLILVFLGAVYFLFTLPTTGWDYEIYKRTYESSFFSLSFPFFKTATTLTSEPFYLWYNAFIGVIIGQDFNFPGPHADCLAANFPKINIIQGNF